MSKLTLGLVGGLAAAALGAPALAQPPHPTCTLSPTQVEANRQTGMAFFRPGITAEQRIAMVDPSYVQHDPVFRKFAEDNKMTHAAGFAARLRQAAGQPAAAAGAGPAAPPVEQLFLVTIDCDLVTILHKTFRQTPGAAPGAWYEVFTFDTFRVKDGLFTEHWDGAVLPPAG